MDQLFELLPLIIGIIWFLSKRKNKAQELPRETEEPQGDARKTLEDIFRELEQRTKGQTPQPQPETYTWDDEEEEEEEQKPEYVFSYDEVATKELQRQEELRKYAEINSEDHHAFASKQENKVQPGAVEEEDQYPFDLRQAVISEVILNRPNF